MIIMCWPSSWLIKNLEGKKATFSAPDSQSSWCISFLFEIRYSLSVSKGYAYNPSAYANEIHHIFSLLISAKLKISLGPSTLR